MGVKRRGASCLGFGVLLAVAATAWGAAQASGPLPTAPPLAITDPANSAADWTLSRLNPVTLAPTGTSLDIGEYHGSADTSPDRTKLVIGRAAGGPANGVGILIVDVSTLSLVTGIRTPIAVSAVQWLAPRRVVAFLQTGIAVVADPLTGKIIRSVAAGGCGTDQEFAQTRRALVVLGEGEAISIDQAGHVRRAALPGLQSSCRASVTYDPDRDHVIVAGAGARIYDIDVATMHAIVHRLTGPALHGRPTLTWAGPGRVAAAHRTQGDQSEGVELIGTGTWTRRTIDPHAGAVAMSGTRLLVYGGAIGVRGYDLAGRRRLSELAGEHVTRLQAIGHYAYALTATGVHIIDVALGKAISATPGGPGDLQLIS